jgi:hypothetical protein
MGTEADGRYGEWEPKTMTTTTETKSTAATRKHPGVIMRFFEGLTFTLVLGVLGAVAMIIPPLGFIVLLAAAMGPFYCLLKTDSCDRLRGACPHCTREVEVKWEKAKKSGFDCKFCKRRIVTDAAKGDERFLGV